MKKIIFLILLTLTLTGCYDYQELNNRAIITGCAIDLEQNQIKVTYEIISTKKSDSKENEDTKSYFIEGSGTTIAEAFQKANLSLSKEPTFSHIKTIVFSEEIAEKKLADIIDYLIRNPEIYNLFYPIITKEGKASDILKTSSKENPVASETIKSMIENNKSNNTLSVKIDYEEFLSQLIDSKSDAYLNVISKDEQTLKLDGIAIFKEKRLADILDEEEAKTFNVLNNQSPNYYIKASCPNDPKKYINIDLYQNKKTNIEFKENQIFFKSNLEGSIIEDNCNFNFRDPKVYQEVSELFKKEVATKFQDVYQVIQKNQSDVLQLQTKYFKKTRKDLEKWYEYQANFEVSLKINKNGLIFEVKEND